MNHTDLTFITNEAENKITDRFKTLIKDTEFFDVLVGYFYTSGFWQIYPEIEITKRIRILIGINTNREVYNSIQTAKNLSHSAIKTAYSDGIKSELEFVKESKETEKGIEKFIEWIRTGKLEIKAYPSEKIHSKLYIMSFHEGDRDVGRVITGSSNFTLSGFSENLEFNVELKNRSDFDYAKNKFEELWKDSIDVSEKYIETIETKTWINNTITPYELYLKFLYEYFKDEISQTGELDLNFKPENFKELRYQTEAVINAQKIVKEYGGVFISDVVGLGKTYMGTMLAGQISTKTLVIAPPRLVEKENPGSWYNAFKDFGFRSRDYACESIGKLDQILDWPDLDTYDTVLIDEAHRFRNENNDTYSKIAEICAGKKVVLLTATPFNNRPSDLLAQIKLFQKSKNSTLPNLKDLDSFFSRLESRLSKLDRRENPEEYMEVIKSNAKEVRERVLKYLMVRRTRGEIEKYYGKDLHEQGMQFPKIADPEPIYYEFSQDESIVFQKTITLAKESFRYSRYAPLLYIKSEIWRNEQEKNMGQQGQRNMMRFMKMLLVKRLESSFFAFRNTLDRFIESYEKFLDIYESGVVYVSAKHTKKISDALENADFDYIDSLIEQEKADRYVSSDFDPKLKDDLEHDLAVLYEIRDLWKKVHRDPKLESFKKYLKTHEALRTSKILIFSESEETAQYLGKALETDLFRKVFIFTGGGSEKDRNTVTQNFDNNSKSKKDDYEILVTTDVLSEGVNLHRGNVVINYDIPWNPTRIMQRVGRINRVDTPHKTIHTFTCFPTDEANDEIGLKEAAEAKISAFIAMLGSDAKLLTDSEEVESHSLFEKIMSRELIEGEEEGDSELKYLSVIRDIRDNFPELFEKIKRLPKKSRSAIASIPPHTLPGLLTYYRKGQIEKFCFSDEIQSKELDFMESAHFLECSPESKRARLSECFYELKERNDLQFDALLDDPMEEVGAKRGGYSNALFIVKVLKSKEIHSFKGFTEDDEQYLESIIKALENGAIPKNTILKLKKTIETQPEILINPLKLLFLLRSGISSRFLNEGDNEGGESIHLQKEVVLSLYFA